MNRRAFLASFAAALGRAAARLPVNNNIKWALSLGLWQHFRPVAFTEILSVMRDTGFIGIRLTDFPRCFETYGLTPSQMGKKFPSASCTSAPSLSAGRRTMRRSSTRSFPTRAARWPF